MDEELATYGLHVPSFARQRKVSEKTVRRDLAVFRRLGMVMRREWQEGHPRARQVWVYVGSGRLFRRPPLPPQASGPGSTPTAGRG